MIIIYLVVITTLLISNSKACGRACPCPLFGSSVKGGQKYPKWPDLPQFANASRVGTLGQTSQLDSNVFEHCDMDRNGLTWNEVSSCIVSFFYVILTKALSK